MNYACISDQPFVTNKNLAVKKQMSSTAKSIRDFYRAHSFSVSVNPSTGVPEVRITKEQDEA